MGSAVSYWSLSQLQLDMIFYITFFKNRETFQIRGTVFFLTYNSKNKWIIKNVLQYIRDLSRKIEKSTLNPLTLITNIS